MTALAEEARRWLLAQARSSVRSALHGGREGEPRERPVGVDARRGCFVSLHLRTGELRGCIGTFDESCPLWVSVRAMAAAAATRDYRFPPLSADELDDVVIEISALTPRAPIRPEDVVVGEHGLWIECGARHGVLLPQVAVSHGWDARTFLEHTCVKAGLPPDAWRQPEATLEAFGAEVFAEDADTAHRPAA